MQLMLIRFDTDANQDTQSPSKQTSCYAVLGNEDGTEVCLDKRNSSKKKGTATKAKKNKKEENDTTESRQRTNYYRSK